MSEHTWKTWVQMQIIGKNCKTSLKYRLGTSNKLTRLINDPTKATHAEVLIFAAELDMHPYELLQEFGLGAQKMTQEEKDLLCSHFALKSSLRKHTEQEHSQAA
jgi:hypothetical protein